MILYDIEDLFLEAYYGKSQTLLECEKVIQKIILKQKENPLSNINKYDENKILQQLLIKQFGFRDVIIYWNTSTLVNVYTLVNSHVIQIMINKNVIKDKIGYYDDTHTEVCVIQINSAIITNLNLSPTEIMAILLHEIGHNFDMSPFKILNFCIGFISYNSMQIVREFMGSNIMKVPLNFIISIPDRVVQSIPILKKIAMVFTKINKVFLQVQQTVFSPLYASASIVMLPFTPLFHLGALPVRATENFADSFTSAYGYSLELSSALEKCNDYYTRPKMDDSIKNGFVRFLINLGICTKELNDLMLGNHGSNQERVLTMITRLKNDLSSTPKEFQPELKKEVDKLEKYYNDFITKSENEKDVLTKTYRTMIDKVIKGTYLQDLIAINTK